MGSVEVEVNQIVNENCYIYHCCHISIINRRSNIFQGFLFMISQLCTLTLLANGSSQYLVIFCCCFMAILKIDWLVFNQCQVCSVQVNTWWELTVNIPPISTRNNHISPQERLRHMTLKIQFLAGNRHKDVAGLHLLMESHPPYDNWISQDNTDINKQ